jgi:hypothetical protein
MSKNKNNFSYKIKEQLRRFFAKNFYPAYRRDWYKSKGYLGATEQEQFANFLIAQKQPDALLFGEFDSLNLERQFICSNQFELDSVLITPHTDISASKPGEGLVFVMLQGRSEYYESRFRDMARLAKYTGAAVLGFNPKGFHSSSGHTLQLSDLVDDGIAAISFLLQKGFAAKNIIIFGNSIGAAIGQIVSDYFYHSKQLRFRQINSNSFKSLGAVVANHYHSPFLAGVLSKVMIFAGWETTRHPDFYTTGPYKCVLRRANDKTIKEQVEYYSAVNYKLDYLNVPLGYRKSFKWLNDNNQLLYLGQSKKDPHILSLHNFKIKAQNENGEHLSVFNLVNFYLTASNEFI